MRPPLPPFAGLLAELSYEELGVTTVDLDVDVSTATEVALSDSGASGGSEIGTVTAA